MEVAVKPVDCVAIVSGGLDSVTLLHYLVQSKKAKPYVISFQYGQKHVRELQCAEINATELGCPYSQIDLTGLGALFDSSALVSGEREIPHIETVMGDPQPPTYVPNRNMLFLSIAAAFAENKGVGTIYYGAQRHDIYGYWDTTQQFLERLNSVYALNRKSRITIEAPFVTFSKTDTLKLGLSLGVDYAKTWSCYAGGDKACGVCPTCAERLTAFKEAGIPDPLPYRAS